LRTTPAEALAQWAHDLRPTAADCELADRSLRDTLAVMLAARSDPLVELTRWFDDGPRWAVAGHVLDYDDLHVPSTTHVSAICVPTALAAGGGARAYLAAAGVMARLGNALGWAHYSAGWHATCTAGAPAAAAGAAVAWGLDPEQTAAAIALSVPGAGGVQRSFGTDGKALQVGSAVEAGMRAARLAGDGARGDPSALEVWMRLVGGDPAALDLCGPAVPGGLATKIYPCCYALQRPISALAGLAGEVQDWRDVVRIVLHTAASTVEPLIHHTPTTGLEGKFSIEYAAATAFLDAHQGLDCFTDAAVRRQEAREIMKMVEIDLEPGGTDLLSGKLTAEVEITDGTLLSASQRFPPGSPQKAAGRDDLAAKLADCARGLDLETSSWTWEHAAEVLREHVPGRSSAATGGR
jgi:2-methylcitrate dehydratase PrpD